MRCEKHALLNFHEVSLTDMFLMAVHNIKDAKNTNFSCSIGDMCIVQSLLVLAVHEVR